MQLIYIYGWDIDFILDIRKGDSFKVIYEEKYKNREKVGNGPVLAAEFNNQDRKIRAVRYERDNGQVDYYTGTGTNMRKAFLRNPLNFSRISSHFNLRRKHPVLNRIRAHKGVDYAAPTGTPIKVTGDGTIQFLGKKGGYGKSIIVKHGGKYSTLYAHLSRYRKGLKRTQPVKQGQVVGYVGKTGLATGPHLHYEFRVNNRHHNPLTVKLPGAENVPLPRWINSGFAHRTCLPCWIPSIRSCWRSTIRTTGYNRNSPTDMYYIGLMSGTSADAIDAALVDISGDDLEIIDYRQYPLAADVQQALRSITPSSSIEEMTELDVLTGQHFGHAVLSLLEVNEITAQAGSGNRQSWTDHHAFARGNTGAHLANRRSQPYFQPDGDHHRGGFPPGRHGCRGPGRTAGASFPCLEILPRPAGPHRIKYRRHSQYHAITRRSCSRGARL